MKKINISVKGIASLSLMTGATLGLGACKENERPNFLIILADDFGGMDTGACGSTYYETPNIDRIAAEGIHFTDGYAACNVSSPTRASLMTGMYTPCHGITDWIGSPSGEAWRKKGWHNMMLPPDYEHNLDTEKFLCLPQALKDAGYSTFMAGKWHLGDQTTPEMAGFEINKGGYHAGQPKGGYFSPYQNPKLEDGPDGENLSMRLAHETNAFIEDHLKENGSKKPFMAYLSFYATHTPVETTKENWEYFRQKAVDNPVTDREAFKLDGNWTVAQIQDNPLYAGLVRQMDDAVGCVTRRLKELGVDKNTIVIFMSDNGGFASLGWFSTANYPYRGGKSYQWEGGTRIPFFIYAPMAKDNGRKCLTPVNTVDIYPTLLDYAQVECPDVDGVSLRPIIEGSDIEERPLFWHYPHYGGSGGDPTSIIRDGDWKLIYYHEDSHCELYNLREDMMEQHNVISDNASMAEEMKNTLLQWLKDSGAKMPVPDPEYSPEERQKFLVKERKKILDEQNRKRDARLKDDYQPNKTWWGSQAIDD